MHEPWKCRRRAGWLGGVTMAGVAGLMASAGLAAQGRPGLTDTLTTPGGGTSAPAVERVSADLTLRHWRVDEAGQASGVLSPAVTLRLARERSGSRWRTALSLAGLERASAQARGGLKALENPFVVARLEYDEDGSAPRLYNARGQLMSGPAEADRERLGLAPSRRDATWNASELLASLPSAPGRPVAGTIGSGIIELAADRSSRRAGIEQAFGRRAGRVRGLDQFVRREDGRVHELLVTAETGLPAAFVVTQGTQVVSRAEFEYEPFGGDAFARKRARAEHLLPASGGIRVVTELTFANVAWSQRGSR